MLRRVKQAYRLAIGVLELTAGFIVIFTIMCIPFVMVFGLVFAAVAAWRLASGL